MVHGYLFIQLTLSTRCWGSKLVKDDKFSAEQPRKNPSWAANHFFCLLGMLTCKNAPQELEIHLEALKCQIEEGHYFKMIHTIVKFVAHALLIFHI